MKANVTPADAAAICDHMNADHGDAVAAYARAFASVADVASARMLGIDDVAMELQIDTPTDSVIRRIPFDHELTGKDDARETLIKMARDAMTA